MADDIPQGDLARDALITAKLSELGIAFERIEHAPILTTREGAEIAARTGSLCMKNLFLSSKKGRWLLLMPSSKSFASKSLAAQIGSGHLSFGSDEDLKQLLGTYRGAVTCLGLLFDVEERVQVLIDEDLLQVDRVDCHPCRNTATLAIRMQDILEKWLPATGHGNFRYVHIE